eukprot:1160470-Pelagomonas_calceolata.AAC.1
MPASSALLIVLVGPRPSGLMYNCSCGEGMKKKDEKEDEKERHLWPQQCHHAQVKPRVYGLKAQDTGSVQPHDWQTKASHV